ncbi:hypothetical protein IE81DRAFT_294067 [Ceraceosorus guamensis]|uniref:C4-dicarboxylate transporter/malic acid transport protein n=1 Tax=Ceraceosorus guamensis TaxID=1522189 RepID=A0A316VSD5_9BASI|nr:hypothetical protein IE81DRAFT_294067 [Ceraceosorus guamensis]PWN39968.1 hypothetical protein IE81DRAFT_294067 [Ceraceosorus guamensis]
MNPAADGGHSVHISSNSIGEGSSTDARADDSAGIDAQRNGGGSLGKGNVNSLNAAEAGGGLSGRYARYARELRRITLHFTPSWFSVNMGTGITSILLYQLPYQFKGLHVIAEIIFALNVALFLVFTSISAARYTIWPTMGPTMLFHESQSLFLGTFAMGLATIVNMCALAIGTSWGHNFALFTWAMWWLDSIISILICLGLPFLQFTRHVQSLDKVTGVWLLPVVAPIVSAASGGILADNILEPSQARLTIIVSYILWGAGFGLAFIIMTLYYARLAIYKVPPATLIVSAFLPLGPCGQGAFGLLKLSESILHLSDRSNQALAGASLFSAQDAHIMSISIYAVSTPIALVLWGLGLAWLSLAISSLIDLWLVSELQFNLGWWGFTFPLGVFCTATTQLGRMLDSGAFRILGTVLSLVEVLLWLFIASMTLVRVWHGTIFFAPCLAAIGGEPPAHVPPARKYVFEPRQRSRSRSASRNRSSA